MVMEITSPLIGSRVWTSRGLDQHGPAEGPKVDVPPQSGGKISGTRDMFSGVLYEVRWDSGQVTKHYLQELICIGPFTTLSEFESAMATGHSAKLSLGPSGGFREFEMKIGKGTKAAVSRLTEGQRPQWRDVVEPLIRRAGIEVKVTKEASNRKKKQKGP